MAGPQFAHIQTFSAKSNVAGQSIAQVIAEATRDPEYSTHVEAPKPPRLLLGDPATFAADHAAHVAARSTRVQMKDGSERVRAIRSDRHTMASIVMSYPVPYAAIKTDEDRAALDRWEKRNLKWLRDTYGDQVKVVLSHEDEAHPHMHAWLLADDPGADATTLHPGKMAKRQVEALAKENGHPPREAVKLGNRALKATMTEWQDAYHAAVGVPEGLTRSGPKRRRLSREQWKAEKATAAANSAALDRAAAATAKADQIEAKGEKVQQDAATLSGVHVALQRREASLSAREEAAADIEAGAEARAAKIISAARIEAKGITDDAEAVRGEVIADAMRAADDMHQERARLAKLMDTIRGLVVRIGKAVGLDLDAGQIERDLSRIDRALSARAEDPRPDAGGDDSPGF